MAKTESEALSTLIPVRVDWLRWSQIRHRDRTASVSRPVSSRARVLVASTQGAAYLTVSEIFPLEVRAKARRLLRHCASLWRTRTWHLRRSCHSHRGSSWPISWVQAS